MSTVAGPNIVKDGLAFHLDMANIQKSNKGKATTNLQTYSQDFTNDVWKGSLFGNWPTAVVTSNSLKAPDKTLTADILTGNYSIFSASIPITVNTTYTFSCWLKNVALSNPVRLHIAYGLNGALVNYNNLVDVPIANISNWTRVSITMTSLASGINQMQCGIDFGGSIQVGGTHAVGIWGAQVELGSFATPYIPTNTVSLSRSNTQSLKDLKGNSTLTSNNLVYNSDGTFNFNRTIPSYIEIPLATSFNKTTGTMNFWIYPTAYDGGNGYFVNRADATANAADWFWIGPYSDTFYFRIGNGSSCCSNDLSFPSVSTVIPLNTWANMCFTWISNGTSAIYKNGVLLTSRIIGNIPATNPAATGRIGLGHYNNYSYFDGRMGNISIYNKALTAQEIKQNFESTRSRYGI